MSEKKPSTRRDKKKPSEASDTAGATPVGVPAEEGAGRPTPVAPAPSLVPASQAKAQHEAIALRASAVRARRMARLGVESMECPVLSIGFDSGPRADPSAVPVTVDGVVVSRLAADIIHTGARPEDLERVAEWLRKK